jgi:transcriptional antiterminator NusG
MDEKGKWYVAHTYSGYENKVKATLEKTVENRDLQDQIFEVVVPLETVTEQKNGKNKTVQKKVLPGYVLVRMIMNDDTWYVVRNTRGVTGFVGPGSKPVPLSEEEILALGVDLTGEAEPKTVVVFDGKVGDKVKILKGAWESTVGEIKTINEGKQTLIISVEMFGRETPVEISYSDVELMD